MKRLIIAAALMPGLAFAGQVNHPSGASLTYGDIPIEHNIYSNLSNPAYGATALERGEGEFRWGLLEFGVQAEVGQLSGLQDKLDAADAGMSTSLDTSGEITSTATTITISGTTLDANVIINDTIADLDLEGYDPLADPAGYQDELTRRVTATLTAQANNLLGTTLNTKLDSVVALAKPALDQLNSDGYGRVGFVARVGAPLVMTSDMWGGSIAIDANINSTGKVGYMYSYLKPSVYLPLTVTDDGAGGYTPVVGTATYTPGTDMAVNIKAALIKELSMGYSRKLMPFAGGNIYLGGKLKINDGLLVQSFVALDPNADTATLISDSLKGQLESDTSVGLDFGGMWIAENYKLGATLNNINSPSLKYNNLSNCDSFSDYYDPADPTTVLVSSTVRQACLAGGKYTMEPQLKLQGVTSVWNDKVTFGIGYDVNGVEDVVGQEYQWLTASTGLNLGNWLALRAGYRANQGEGGITFTTFGMTLLGLNFDAGISNETVKDSKGDEAPRSIYGNFSWAMTF